MNGPAMIPSETMIFPTGVDPYDDGQRYSAQSFAVYVRWQGSRGWVVTGMHRDERLSVKGRKWQHYVPPRNRRFYYFPTQKAAIQAAVEAVDSVKVNGRTWAEWEEHFNG